MPIHKVDGGWKWGEHGKVYASREGAERQAAAAYAHGYKGDDRRAGHDRRKRKRLHGERRA
jgi:hypothetical protein